jgi:S1-C subfamily serine protease
MPTFISQLQNLSAKSKSHSFKRMLNYDLAVCRIHLAENSRDWGYIRAARIRLRPATSGEPVWVTAFTGWGWSLLARSGHITGCQNYQRQDGCRCDFATDITVVEGMSGSPVISSAGEVLGILTRAGQEKFRGLSFGVSFEDAKSFVTAEGVSASGGSPNHEPL